MIFFPSKKWNGAEVDLGYRSLSSQSFLWCFFINSAASGLPSNNTQKAYFPCITLCKHKVERRVFRLILQECCFSENACLPKPLVFKTITCILKIITTVITIGEIDSLFNQVLVKWIHPELACASLCHEKSWFSGSTSLFLFSIPENAAQHDWLANQLLVAHQAPCPKDQGR